MSESCTLHCMLLPVIVYLALHACLPYVFVAAVSEQVEVLQVGGHLEDVHGQEQDEDLDDHPHGRRAGDHSQLFW